MEEGLHLCSRSRRAVCSALCLFSSCSSRPRPGAVALVQFDGLGELVVQLHFRFLGRERGGDRGPVVVASPKCVGGGPHSGEGPGGHRGRQAGARGTGYVSSTCTCPLWELLPVPDKDRVWGPSLDRPSQPPPARPSLDPGLLSFQAFRRACPQGCTCRPAQDNSLSGAHRTGPGVTSRGLGLN